MFFSIIKVCFVLIIIVLTINLITPETANAHINITQHADNIFNCTNSGIFGDKSCFQNMTIKNHQENNKLLSSSPDSTKNDLEENTGRFPTSIDTASQPTEKKTSQLDSFFLNVIGLFTGISGVIFISSRAKKLFSVQIKGIKERIEILETIVTKE